jgi:chromosome segregation protein
MRRLEQKKLASEMEEKQIIDKLWDTYEVTRSAALGIRRELAGLGDAKRRDRASLKRKSNARRQSQHRRHRGI